MLSKFRNAAKAVINLEHLIATFYSGIDRALSKSFNTLLLFGTKSLARFKSFNANFFFLRWV